MGGDEANITKKLLLGTAKWLATPSDRMKISTTPEKTQYDPTDNNSNGKSRFMCILLPVRTIGVLFYSMTVLGCFAQTVTSSQSIQSNTSALIPSTLQNQSTLQAFQTEQQALNQSLLSLIAQGATPAQIQAWQQQNAASFALQQQRMQAMAATSASQIESTNQSASVTPNASSTLQAFLSTRATLENVRAQIHNQLIQAAAASGLTLTSAQVQQISQEEATQFQQQYGSLLQLQAQRMQTLAVESIQQQANLKQGPPSIPQGASPQLTAYLTAKSQLHQSLVQIESQYASSDPQTRQAALLQWEQQNAALFQQVQQAAQNLQTNPNN